MIIKLDFKSDIPIYLQLRNQIIIGIAKGELAFNESLPTVRQMASDLGINNMTVNKAYAILKNEQFISIDRRYGAKVDVKKNKDKYMENLYENLTLMISEAGIKGIKQNEFYDICNSIYNSMKNINLSKGDDNL